MSESLPLSGRCALVTGAAKRTGRALALALAEAGADVAVHYRASEREARETADEIAVLGRRATTVQADLVDADAASAAIEGAIAALGRLDILVNNVGAIAWKRLDALSPADWRDGIEGTLTVTVHACRAAIPHMRTRGYGRIINILDADADLLHAVDMAAPYKIGKTASWMLTKSLAAHEAEHGITVNAVSPGTLENSEKQPPMSRVPMGRPGKLSEVADAVVFLAREDAGYLTGTNIKVSGGYLI